MEQRHDAFRFVRGDPCIQVFGRQVVLEVQAVQHQDQGLVQRIVGAMAEEQARLIEPAAAPAYPITQGDQFKMLRVLHTPSPLIPVHRPVKNKPYAAPLNLASRSRV